MNHIHKQFIEEVNLNFAGVNVFEEEFDLIWSKSFYFYHAWIHLFGITSSAQAIFPFLLFFYLLSRPHPCHWYYIICLYNLYNRIPVTARIIGKGYIETTKTTTKRNSEASSRYHFYCELDSTIHKRNPRSIGSRTQKRVHSPRWASH